MQRPYMVKKIDAPKPLKKRMLEVPKTKCSSSKIVKWLFKFFTDGQTFDFPKLFQYGILPYSYFK